MAITFSGANVYGSPQTFIDSVMFLDQQLWGSGTMIVDGQNPLVDRGSYPFYTFSDEIFFNGYSNQNSPPFIVWRLKDMYFDRIKQTGGFNGVTVDQGIGVPPAQGYLTGTIGSWFTTFECKVTGRNAAEAFNEVNNLMGTLEEFPSNPPIRKQRCTPFAQGNVESNGLYTYLFSFEVPLIVNPAPLSTNVLILTASALISASIASDPSVQLGKQIVVFSGSM